MARTFTTPILLPGNPAAALQAVPQQYCDTKVASVTAANSTITVAGSATAPTVAVGTLAESNVTGLVTDLAAKVPTTRNVTAGTGLTGGGALSSDVTLAVSYGTSSTTAAVGNDTRITGAAPAASPTFTGTSTFSGVLVQTPVVLTDGTSVAVNASLGNLFRLTITATSHTMAAPSSPTDGQLVMFEIVSGGAFTLSWATGTGGYVFGTDVTQPTLSQTSGKTDYIGFIYRSSANIWRCLAYARGF